MILLELELYVPEKKAKDLFYKHLPFTTSPPATPSSLAKPQRESVPAATDAVDEDDDDSKPVSPKKGSEKNQPERVTKPKPGDAKKPLIAS